MSNFYLDNPDIRFHMNHMDLERIISFKEDDFVEKDAYPHAPKDAEDTRDNYHRVLEIVGEIAGDFVAERAPEVDQEGARFENGEVIYARGTVEAMDRLKKSDLGGFTLARKYDGINMPKIIYAVATEMISRADASLMNIFGLQEIADTIYHFGSEEQKQKYLPRFASGTVLGAMALTEPDAGSDLQSVALKAKQNENGEWFLNGVKRFITNGCAEISLVMARSEEGSTGGRGISLFIYEREPRMTIRRIEHKLGIKGSPTCEMQFNDAPAELLGQRKMGLVKYTMSLMNGARLAVAAQAVGIAEAAYREARKYAEARQQFKKPILKFSAIYEMLTDMKVNIEGARTLLYETARVVDLKEGIEERIHNHPEKESELRDDFKRYSRYSALLTPMIKAFAAEMANRVCYDAVQIHGGVGYTCEFNVERHLRDVRITNIYEGTTQLQIVATIGGVIGGIVFERLNDYEKDTDFAPVSGLFGQVRELRGHLESAVSYVKEKKDSTYQEFHALRLVNMATDVLIGYLLCMDALKSDRKKRVAEIYVSKARYRVQESMGFILSNETGIIDFHHEIISDG
ncbi:MAG: acyl-CoA dehydrogenase family protein [Proteobacteria bacterium]|nr:acyl-CoA dehydrogenase family protein [Pseudomonadota bacterium]